MREVHKAVHYCNARSTHAIFSSQTFAEISVAHKALVRAPVTASIPRNLRVRADLAREVDCLDRIRIATACCEGVSDGRPKCRVEVIVGIVHRADQVVWGGSVLLQA